VALEAFGRRYGIDEARGVTVFALDSCGNVIDKRARLWAQTERLRASLTLASSDSEHLLRSALASFTTLRVFLSTERAGLWREWMDGEGQFISEPSPASSLYHVVSAMSELCKLKR
jgi:mannose-6-phosphate isomerase